MSDTTDPALLERAVFATATQNEIILDTIATDFAAAIVHRNPYVRVSLESLRIIHDALSGTNALMNKLFLDNAPLDAEVEKFLESIPTE